MPPAENYAAVELLQKCAAIQPTFALAHTALAEAWPELGYNAEPQLQLNSRFHSLIRFQKYGLRLLLEVERAPRAFPSPGSAKNLTLVFRRSGPCVATSIVFDDLAQRPDWRPHGRRAAQTVA